MDTFVERNFSDLLRESGEVLKEAERRDVLLRRRDGADMMLVDAHREGAIREALAAAAQILSAIFDEFDFPGEGCRLWEAIPWTHFLPTKSREVFLNEFIATTRACNELNTYEPLALMLHAWKSTAAIYADPQLLAVLSSPSEGSRRRVPRP